VSFIKNSPNIAVRNGSKWGLVSPEGEMLIEMRYNRIHALGDDLYALNRGKNLYIKHENTKEKKLKRIQSLGNTAEGRIALLKKDKWLLADTSLNVLSKEAFTYLRTMNQGYAVGKIGNTSYLLDSLGQITIQTSNRLIGSYSDGFILCYYIKDNRYSYLSKTGENLLGNMYLEALPFSQGKAWVRVETGWGCIDTAGEWIISPHYFNLQKLEHNAYAVTKAFRFGMCDSAGKMILDPVYDKIEIKDQNLIMAAIGTRISWKYAGGSTIYDRITNPTLAKTP